ncbi:MAG: RyR domain-containing protein [Beijerinckiaceae bacterium]
MDVTKDRSKEPKPRVSGRNRNGRRRAARWLPSLSALPFILAAGAILTGLAGWALQSFDGTFHSIATSILRTLRAFFPTDESLKGGNVLTDVSAVFGALTTCSSVVLIIFATLRESSLKFWAHRLLSNHVVVIGNSAFADRVASAFHARGIVTIQVIEPGVSGAPADGLFVRHQIEAASLLETFGLRRTRCIVIDRSDDAATLSLAHALLTRLRETAPRRKGGVRVLALAVADSSLADHFGRTIAAAHAQSSTNIEDDLQISFVDEALTSARDCLARTPLYLLAEKRRQRRVHALIDGFNDLGEKFFEEILLTSLAGDLGPPRVTIITRESVSCERHFRARRPGFAEDSTIAFFDADLFERLDDGSFQDAASFSQLEQEDPVTAIFLTSEDDGEVVRTALGVHAVQRRTGRIAAPIFFPEPAAGQQSDILSITSDQANWDQAQPDQKPVVGKFIQFGVSDEILLDQISDPDGRDALARALHEDYLSHENISPAAAKPWRLLPETLRRANYHAADHFRAKLHTLGFAIHDLPLDVVPTLSAEDELWLFGTKDTKRAADAEVLLEKLARLEHERWCIERRLNGWVYDEKRDDARRRHDLLLPWEILLEKHPRDPQKDRDLIAATLRFLIARGDKDHVVVRRVANIVEPDRHAPDRATPSMKQEET